MKRFSYSIRPNQHGEYCAHFDIRTQHHGAKIGLTSSDTLELWITAAEMPTIIATMVDSRLWEAHRLRILEMLAEHYLHRFHQPPQ